MGVGEALETLARTGDEFLVFTNAASQQLAVLYRRKDGNYGLIEPEGR
jgi:putative sigma-54 modulation protein